MAAIIPIFPHFFLEGGPAISISIAAALTGGTLRVVNQDGDTHDMTWEAGSAYWLEADPPGELHGDVNEGTEPVEVIVVQLKGVGTGGS